MPDGTEAGSGPRGPVDAFDFTDARYGAQLEAAPGQHVMSPAVPRQGPPVDMSNPGPHVLHDVSQQGTVTPRRPQGLGWSALVVTAGVSAAIGVGAYQALATIDVTSVSPLVEAGRWAVVAVVGLVLSPFVVVLTVVALVRTRGTAAVLALVAALVLPLGALWIGLQSGGNALMSHITEDTEGMTTAAVEAALTGLNSLGPAAEPLRDWLTANYASVD